MALLGFWKHSVWQLVRPTPLVTFVSYNLSLGYCWLATKNAVKPPASLCSPSKAVGKRPLAKQVSVLNPHVS
ncbi:uncharacterized protein F4817DRAFT_336702, partial [Daldinia loculata]|uniref:uncharacterized protein n=1 Tax=Daldinia loculata TaxID=103429 RepID=UPI0020C52F05